MAAFCASIGRVLAHRSGTVNWFSASESGRDGTGFVQQDL